VWAVLPGHVVQTAPIESHGWYLSTGWRGLAPELECGQLAEAHALREAVPWQGGNLGGKAN